MTILKVKPTQTIKSPCNNKKSLYGQNLKPQSKFNKMLHDEIKRLNALEVSNRKQKE